MWVESSMQIGNQDVQVRVERLEDEIRDRTAIDDAQRAERSSQMLRGDVVPR